MNKAETGMTALDFNEGMSSLMRMIALGAAPRGKHLPGMTTVPMHIKRSRNRRRNKTARAARRLNRQ